VVAAVSVSGPIERLSRQPGRLHAQIVCAAAAKLSDVLQHGAQGQPGQPGQPTASGAPGVPGTRVPAAAGGTARPAAGRAAAPRTA
jgi:hypothetical protein